MEDVMETMGLISKLDGNYITVHQERCVLVRNRNTTCLRCADVCTSGCISHADGKLIIAPELCIGCGTCASVCPSCALEAHHPNDAELLDRCLASSRKNEGTVYLACGVLLDSAQATPDPTKTVRVECLGRVEESLLTALAAAGCHEVVLAHGECGTCEHQTGRKTLDLICHTERQLLDAWDTEMALHIRKGLPTTTSGMPSHEAQDAGDKGTAVGDADKGIGRGNPTVEAADENGSVEPLRVMADGTLPHFVPDRRERLLDALAALGTPSDVELDTRLWGHVVIDTDKCVSCRMCAVFCPTGALAKFQDEDGTLGVEHYAGDCVKCRCCENICPEDALHLSDEVRALDMLAGLTDRYTMAPVDVERSKAHTIWNLMKKMTKGTQVYER